MYEKRTHQPDNLFVRKRFAFKNHIRTEFTHRKEHIDDLLFLSAVPTLAPVVSKHSLIDSPSKLYVSIENYSYAMKNIIRF